MDLNEFAVDLDRYENGKRIEFSPTAYIVIRSTGSERARKVLERLWEPYATWREVPQEVTERIDADLLAQGLLVEFVGFTDGDKPIVVDLTIEADRLRLSEVLRQPKFKPFRGRCFGIARADAQFQAKKDAELEKNSEHSLDGNSAGGGKRKS